MDTGYTPISIVAVVVPTRSCIDTVYVPVLAPVGVPLITPVAGAIDSPVGNGVTIEKVAAPVRATVGAALEVNTPGVPVIPTAYDNAGAPKP